MLIHYFKVPYSIEFVPALDISPTLPLRFCPFSCNSGYEKSPTCATVVYHDNEKKHLSRVSEELFFLDQIMKRVPDPAVLYSEVLSVRNIFFYWRLIGQKHRLYITYLREAEPAIEEIVYSREAFFCTYQSFADHFHLFRIQQF
jgi:hypothetical protein